MVNVARPCYEKYLVHKMSRLTSTGVDPLTSIRADDCYDSNNRYTSRGLLQVLIFALEKSCF